MQKPTAPIRLYRFALSGHAHRVELFLSLLKLPTELIDVDLPAGANKKPEFLKKNPFGQVPVIEDGAHTLSDSIAILVYLALKYGDERWYPRDPLGAAAVQRFLSVAANEIVRGPSAARRMMLFGGTAGYDAAKAVSLRLFGLLDSHLATQPFLAGPAATIADIANYTYVAHAPEGGIALTDHANLRRWLTRVEALPGFVPMQASPIPQQVAAG